MGIFEAYSLKIAILFAFVNLRYSSVLLTHISSEALFQFFD